VQWLTAGRGIVHSEMFPLLDRDGPNHLELFQIWMNLPAEDKMVDPYFTMLWSDDIPVLTEVDDDGRMAEVTVIAGELAGLQPPAPPPNSWASRAEADVAIWHVRLDPDAAWQLPPARSSKTSRTLYVFGGDELAIGELTVGADTGAVLDPEASPILRAAGSEVDALLLQGVPIAQPVAQYGPFVMNTRAEIEQAFADYQRTQFGGWPWDSDHPVHGRDQGRFARHADGHVEEVTGVRAT
jgi:redox-sensitive bicupin YhaK (pirin superfamily)